MTCFSNNFDFQEEQTEQNLGIRNDWQLYQITFPKHFNYKIFNNCILITTCN